jgi:hypothetical protein
MRSFEWRREPAASPRYRKLLDFSLVSTINGQI